MARNKLSDLNNHLFAQLERLNDEDIDVDDMVIEVKKAQAITAVASQIIKSSKMIIDVMKMMSDDKYNELENLPKLSGFQKEKDE